MTPKLLSPIQKTISKQLDAEYAALRAAEAIVRDRREMIDTLQAVPLDLEVGARLRVRNLREPLPIELEQYRGAEVEITRVEKHPGCKTGFNIHFSHLGVEAGALDLSWFEAA